MTNKPLTRTNWLCLAGSACILAAAFAFIAWTDNRFHTRAPSPQETREQWRVDQLEKKRAKHYIEHIKPNLPSTP
jgi:hypothetical protein